MNNKKVTQLELAQAAEVSEITVRNLAAHLAVNTLGIGYPKWRKMVMQYEARRR